MIPSSAAHLVTPNDDLTAYSGQMLADVGALSISLSVAGATLAVLSLVLWIVAYAGVLPWSPVARPPASVASEV